MRPLQNNIVPLRAAASVTTAAIPTRLLFAISAQITASGGATGTMKLQASNDFSEVSSFVPVNWTDISGATVTVSTNASFLIPKTEICYEYVRIVYTDSTTGGTISINIKALGA